MPKKLEKGQKATKGHLINKEAGLSALSSGSRSKVRFILERVMTAKDGDITDSRLRDEFCEKFNVGKDSFSLAMGYVKSLNDNQLKELMHAADDELKLMMKGLTLRYLEVKMAMLDDILLLQKRQTEYLENGEAEITFVSKGGEKVTFTRSFTASDLADIANSIKYRIEAFSKLVTLEDSTKNIFNIQNNFKEENNVNDVTINFLMQNSKINAQE
ncbi:MAG: hypothetical protein WAS72_05890 [Saprospiraceae bacterium]